MSYQAGQRNFQVATGADSVFAVRFHRRGDTVDASTIAAGDFVVYQSAVWPVFSTTPAGAGKVTLRLGAGTFYEPEVTLLDTDQVTRADAATWEDVDMQVALPATAWTPPPATLAVPTNLADDVTTVMIEIGQTWLEPFQAQIDYADGGPSGMSLPYDLVGVFGGLRIRVLTGTISIVRSAASPVVDPPPELPEEMTP